MKVSLCRRSDQPEKQGQLEKQGQPHPPPTVVPLPLPGEGLRCAFPFRSLTIREKTAETQNLYPPPSPFHAPHLGFIRPLDRRRPQRNLPVVRGGGTACPTAVTEGIATDSDTIFHRLHLINLIQPLHKFDLAKNSAPLA